MFAEIIVFDETAVSTAITNRPQGKCTNEHVDFDKTFWPKRARPLRIVEKDY